MKYILNYLTYAVLFLLIPLTSHGQNPTCIWGKNFHGTGPGEATGAALATTNNGSVYFAGHFSTATLGFGSITLQESLPGISSSDIFIAKYDASGNVEWVRKSTGTGNSFGSSYTMVSRVASDPQGNVIVIGRCISGSITFGNQSLGNSCAIFVVKYDSNGNLMWAKGYGTDAVYPKDITTDHNGNIFLLGENQMASVTFGSITLNNPHPVGSNGYYLGNTFLVKFDASGNVLWAKKTTGAIACMGRGVCTDLNGNVIITGLFIGDSLNLGSVSIPSSGWNPMFFLKLDASGNPVWGKKIEKQGICWGLRMATDPAGNVYATGNFSDTAMNFGNTILSASGSGDIYLMKMNPAGQILWAKKAGGVSMETVGDIGLDAVGNIYLSGYFISPVLSFGPFNLNKIGGEDIFVAKYDPSGTVTWAKNIPSSQDTISLFYQASAVAPNGDLYLTGQYGSPSLALDTVTITNPISPDMSFYLAKFGTGQKDDGGNDTTNAIAENDFNKELEVYPIPSQGNIMLSSNFFKGSPVMVAVSNLTGKNIFSEKIKIHHSGMLHLNLAPGIYFLELKMKQGQAVRKIVIK